MSYRRAIVLVAGIFMVLLGSILPCKAQQCVVTPETCQDLNPPHETLNYINSYCLDKSTLRPGDVANETWTMGLPAACGQPTGFYMSLCGDMFYNTLEIDYSFTGLNQSQPPTAERCTGDILFAMPTGSMQLSLDPSAPAIVQVDISDDGYGIPVLGTLTLLPDLSADLGPCTQCELQAGQPINVNTGNVWIQQTDYAIPGLGGGVQLSRTWNSLWQFQNTPSVAGMFGHSWRMSYEELIQTIDSNNKKYWRGDGSAWQFTWNGTVYVLSAPTDTTAALSFNTTTNQYTLTFADGTEKLFDNSGRLIAIVDRNGNQANLTYDASGRLSQITTAGNQTVTFSYGDPNNPDQATSIQDSTGPIATFTYDASSRMASVAYPDGSGALFAYDNNSLITSVTDPQGKTLETHTYDTNGRGLTSAKAGGAEQVTMNYDASGNTLTDSLGNVTTYNGGRINGRNYIATIVGPGCSSCGGRGTRSYGYDSSGHMLKSVDPMSNWTLYTYDDSGNMTSKQDYTTGQTWNYAYNSFGEVLTASDPLAHVTTNTYARMATC